MSSATANERPLLPWPNVDHAAFGPVEVIDIPRMRSSAARNLTRNYALIPHVTQHDELDIQSLDERKEAVLRQHPGLKLSPLVFVIEALAKTLKKLPHFNASLDASGTKLTLKKYIHIGVAVDTPDGLRIPVLRNCDKKHIATLAVELADFADKARQKALSSDDMAGGSITVSSLGGIGGTAFTPIIKAPELAILGLSKTCVKAVWDGHAFMPRKHLPVSLSYDHRVIDGADAARFTTELGGALNVPSETE